MSDLHDRITAALFREDQLRVCKLSDADIKFMADAVIAELRLERETWNPDMGVSVLPRHMWVKPTPVYRYVTDWVQTND